MTLQQYKNLSEEYQMHILKHKAVIIATLPDDEGIYTLFQVYGFYIEFWCSNAAGMKSSLNYFEETALVEPYLESINISSVYQVLNLNK